MIISGVDRECSLEPATVSKWNGGGTTSGNSNSFRGNSNSDENSNSNGNGAFGFRSGGNGFGGIENNSQSIK